MSVEQALLRRRALMIVAHPDDETVGAGGLLPRLAGLTILYLTDGAPRQTAEIRRAGFRHREDYADARGRELLDALRLAGISGTQIHSLGVVDQEVSLQMAYVTLKLVHLLRDLRPAVILTHSYEGGHPDHDAAAFAVHAACARVEAPPEVYEFTSYHAAAQVSAAGSAGPRPPRMETGSFLSGTDPGETIVLDEAARLRKGRMVECFATQTEMLGNFALDQERFRPAPAYDFAAAPHEGTLLYEGFGWNIDGRRWRRLARQALKTLGAASL
jgi:LmbE family N-acetylglucosaminyl deacetylase